jgi:hypothetical protein
MTPDRGRCNRYWLLISAVAAAVVAGPAASAGAQVEGPCTVQFNGVEAERVTGLGSPLELDASSTLTFTGTDSSGTREARVELILAMVEVRRGSTEYGPRQEEFSAQIDLGTVAPFGVGLFRVRGTTDNCTVDAWVRISGRYPLTTLTGLTAGGLALGGLAAQLAAVASRRRWSALAAAVAGIATGAGVAGIAQQFGRLQLSLPSIGAVVGVAVLVGTVLAALLTPPPDEGRRERRRAAAARRRATRHRARLEEARLEAARLEAEAAGSRAAAVATPASAGPDESGNTAAETSDPVSGGDVRAAGAPEESVPARSLVVDGPSWCYVLAPVEVLGLDDYNRVVATLNPGTWYLAKRQVGPWVQVTAGDGIEGWVSHDSIHRHG